jgi:hypothetical protein
VAHGVAFLKPMRSTRGHVRPMPQDLVTLDDFKEYANLTAPYRALLDAVGKVSYRGVPFGQIPRSMASASTYETKLEKQRQEGEHALLGLALANDLPAEVLAFDDKPDVDVRYADGSLGGVEVVRIAHETLKGHDSENAQIERCLKEAIGSSPGRGRAMAGRYVMVVQNAVPRRALRQRIVDGVLAWIDEGFPGVTAGDVHVTLLDGQRALADNGVALRLGFVPGTGWEVAVGSAAQDVQVLDIVESVRGGIESKRQKSRGYRYSSGLRLVMPIDGSHPDPLVAADLARLRVADLDIEPFVRVIAYRDLDYVVLGSAR